MKKFRLVSGQYGDYVKGQVYSEDFKMPSCLSVKDWVYTYPNDWEEVIENTTKFNVGDQVRITCVLSGHEFEIGDIVTINKVDHYDTNDSHYYASGWWFCDSECESVDEKSVVADPFEVWLDEKIVTLIQLDANTEKLQEVKRIYRLFKHK